MSGTRLRSSVLVLLALVVYGGSAGGQLALLLGTTSPGAAPSLIVHDDADPVVPVVEGETMHGERREVEPGIGTVYFAAYRHSGLPGPLTHRDARAVALVERTPTAVTR